jgi:hypothetical protein
VELTSPASNIRTTRRCSEWTRPRPVDRLLGWQWHRHLPQKSQGTYSNPSGRVQSAKAIRVVDQRAMSTTAQSNKSLYHPTKWPGFNRASSAEMTAFGILGLINFIACGALLLTHLWCRNTLDVPRKIRRRLRSLKRTNLDQKETDDDDDWFAPELQADRSTLNLLAVSCLSTPPWILLYLDSAVAYSTKPPAYGVCLVQGSFVMGWAVFMAAGAFGVVMSKSKYPPPAVFASPRLSIRTCLAEIWPRITRLNSSLMPYVMPLWLEILVRRSSVTLITQLIPSMPCSYSHSPGFCSRSFSSAL